VVLTSYDDEAHVSSMAALGIAGYVLKDEVSEKIIEALHSVAEGGIWFRQSALEKLARKHSSAGAMPAIADLTERERQALDLLARGWGNTRIATQLHLQEQTVRNYVSRIYEKLGVSSRVEAAILARDRGFGGTFPEQPEE
jgi:DNA-binding NarL/FixJ family response regulator